MVDSVMTLESYTNVINFLSCNPNITESYSVRDPLVALVVKPSLDLVKGILRL